MILRTTYTDKAQTELINDLVGRPFGFWDSLRLNGKGSRRFMIESVSQNLQLVMNTVADINYANIELRPSGILVHINKGLETYCWVVPYYKLSTYKSPNYSIHADGQFVRFKSGRDKAAIKTFFDKIRDCKIDSDININLSWNV